MNNPQSTLSPEAAAKLETIKAREDIVNQVAFEVSRPDNDASVLHIFLRAPVLAEVIRKFETGNHNKEDLAPIYAPVLLPLATLYPEGKNGKMAPPNLIVTRPGIARVTSNFRAAADFSWTEKPCSILLANPDKLAEGFTLIYKVDAPVPLETIRKWGKWFMDGCKDILANARPFKMSWVMEEVHPQQPATGGLPGTAGI